MILGVVLVVAIFWVNYLLQDGSFWDWLPAVGIMLVLASTALVVLFVYGLVLKAFVDSDFLAQRKQDSGKSAPDEKR